ncbi:MAG: hypothetical protein K9N00_04390 [Candidatus Marinimicrobia bacterium]|nr:hypothetical protein [Candidatus Neomarinimicrobiota bacterium]
MQYKKLLIVIILTAGSIFGARNHSLNGEFTSSDSIIITDQYLQQRVVENYDFPGRMVTESLVTLSSPVGFITSMIIVWEGLDIEMNPQIAHYSGAVGGVAIPLMISYIFNQMRRSMARSRIQTRFNSDKIVDRSSLFAPIKEGIPGHSIQIGLNYFDLMTTASRAQVGLIFGLQNEWFSFNNFSISGRSLLINQDRCLLKNKIIRKENNNEISFSRSDLYLFNNNLELGLQINYNLINTKKYDLKTSLGYGMTLNMPFAPEEKIIESNIYENSAETEIEYDYDSGEMDNTLAIIQGFNYLNFCIGYLRDNFSLNLMYQQNLDNNDFFIPTSEKIDKNQLIFIENGKGRSLKIFIGFLL